MQSSEPVDLELRRGQLSDLPELVRLESTSFLGDRVSRRSFRRWLKAQDNILVLQAGGHHYARLLGYALVLFHVRGRVARIYSLAIDSDYRGRGLGRRLLAACLEEARKRGYSEVRLEVAAGNEAALTLYRSFGFEIFDRIDGYYEDGENALRLRCPV